MMKIRLFPPISREVKFLLGSLIAHSVPTGIFLFVLPPYFAQVGRSSVEIGLLFTVSSLSSSFLFMPLGMIADRIGRKPVLIVGSLLPAFSSVIFLSTADLSLLMVAAFLGGIGLGGGMSAAAIGSTFDALLSEKASDGERTYVMSLAQASWTLSLGVGALLSGLPSRLQGMGVLDGVGAYRPLFYGAILLSLLSAALLHPIVERHGRAGGRRVHWLPRRSGRVVARLAVPFLLTGLGVGFIVQHLPLWFQLRYEVPMDRLAPWFSLSEFTGVVTILVVPWMARRLGVGRTLVVLQLGAAFFLALTPHGSTYQAAALFWIARNTLMNFSWPAQQSFTMGIVVPEERASVAGILFFAWGIASAASPIVAGYLLDHGWLVTPFTASALAYGTGAIAFLAISRSHRPPEELLGGGAAGGTP